MRLSAGKTAGETSAYNEEPQGFPSAFPPTTGEQKPLAVNPPKPKRSSTNSTQEKNSNQEFKKLLNTPTENFKYEAKENKIYDFLTEEECVDVINKFATLNNLPIPLAIAGITKLIQDGGTNQSKKNLTVTIGETSFELNNFRSILQSKNKTYTVRKFAKGARDLIIKVSIINQWPGPLVKDLMRIQPNLTISQETAPWCNEIHSDNLNCPHEIRDALIRREEQYKLAFKVQKKPVKQQKKQPRRKRGKK